MDSDQFKARIAQIYVDLERYTYYELLKVNADASPDAIRESFHRMALSMHPDRYHAYTDAEFKMQLYAIYKRIAEGYRVLMDSSQRKLYDKGLSNGETRLVQIERKKTGPKRDEDAIPDPRAKKYFLLGKAAEEQGDLKTALVQYQFAKNLIGENATIQARIDMISAATKK